MRVCVVGCGAVGSLFAANLALLDEVEVWAYDLSEPHVAAINERGLRLTGAGEVHATGIRATAVAADSVAQTASADATAAAFSMSSFVITASAVTSGKPLPKMMRRSRGVRKAENARGW